MRERFKLRISNGILLLNMALIFTTGFVIIFVNTTGTSASLESLSDALMGEIGKSVIEKTLAYLSPAERAARDASYLIRNSVLNDGAQAEELLPFFREQLIGNPEFKMVYYADTEGNLVMARRMPDGSFTNRYVRRKSDHVEIRWKHDNTAYYGGFPDSDDSLETGYDPRKRVWYGAAVERKGLTWTDVYIFATDKQPGFTCALPQYRQNGKLFGVYAVDIGVLELSRFLGQLKITKGASAFIVDGKENIVALQVRNDADASSLMRESVDAKGAKTFSLLGARDSGTPMLPALLDCTKDIEAGSSASFEYGGKPYSAFLAPLETDQGLKMHFLIGIPDEDIMGVAWRNRTVSIVFSTAMIIIAIIASMFFSRAISRPMSTLSSEMGKIKDFDLDSVIKVNTMIYEIDNMQSSFQGMKSGLVNFRRYVPADLVSELIRQNKDANIGGERKKLTIFFSDIAGFTGISESATPEDLVTRLCEYFDIMGGTILKNQGTLDKYIGDSVMAFWGAPRELVDQEKSACLAAIECRDNLASLLRHWENTGKPLFRTRFGIHTGEAIVGNMGSSERINYTVLGDAVNLASRLEGLNKQYGTEILVSSTTREPVAAEFEWRLIDKVSVLGRKEGVEIYELFTRKDDINPSVKKILAIYEEGLALYRERQWGKASEKFLLVLKYRPIDGPSKTLAKRCKFYASTPPGEDWNGVFAVREK